MKVTSGSGYLKILETGSGSVYGFFNNQDLVPVPVISREVWFRFWLLFRFQKGGWFWFSLINLDYLVMCDFSSSSKTDFFSKQQNDETKNVANFY